MRQLERIKMSGTGMSFKGEVDVQQRIQDISWVQIISRDLMCSRMTTVNKNFLYS